MLHGVGLNLESLAPTSYRETGDQLPFELIELMHIRSMANLNWSKKVQGVSLFHNNSTHRIHNWDRA
jgi:hypothetical protein